MPTALEEVLKALEKSIPCTTCEWYPYKGSVYVCELCIWSKPVCSNYKEKKNE